jgi:hypothetical protein
MVEGGGFIRAITRIFPGKGEWAGFLAMTETCFLPLFLSRPEWKLHANPPDVVG